MGKHIIKGVFGKKCRYRYKTVIFTEIAPLQKFAEAEGEVITGCVMFFNYFFEFAVFAAVFVHCIDKSRVFDIMLVGIDETPDDIEFPQMIKFFADKDDSQYCNKYYGNIGHTNHTPNIFPYNS